jgi:aryl-alcohol dehydrogenase-like predicted oxidoreductase
MMDGLTIESRDFGDTELKVSALGYGAGHIGGDELSENEIEKLLRTAVDLGITLFDTARAYGKSEERLGKYLKPFRDQVVYSTKVGYGVEGVEDWTSEAITVGIEEARQKLQTDCIDIVHLHSCPRHILNDTSVVDALLEAKEKGHINVPAYAGENESLDYAITGAPIESIQCSINLFDQRVMHTSLPKAKQRSMGVIAKRPMANAPWRFKTYPDQNYAAEYWNRMKAMNVETGNLSNDEFALRFATFIFGVDSSIVGTTNIDHLKQNVAAVNKGKLPEIKHEEVIELFRTNDNGWSGQL